MGDPIPRGSAISPATHHSGRLLISQKYAEVIPAPILYLHRHCDGYIAFATERDGDDFRPLVSIRAGELETWFPMYQERLGKDAYCSINAGWRLWSYGKNGDAHGYPFHRSNALRRINACYVDIDYYKLNLDLGTVVGRIVNLQESGHLPHASIIVRSGCGLWLLWLISDPNAPGQSPGAWPDQLELYGRIQRAIIERLRPFGADLAANDATRYIRLPGSLHTESENTVEWWIQGQARGGYMYTLAELAEAFNVLPTRRRRGEFISRNPAKRRGWVALNASRLRDFNALRALRGGFTLGCRNNAAKIYAWLLRVNAVPKFDLHGLIAAMGRECHPRLDGSAIRNAVKYSKICRMKDQTISDWLQVTAAEAKALERLPPATGNRSTAEVITIAAPRDLQRRAMVERWAVIKSIIMEKRCVPTVREMSRMINAKGFRGNHQTILKDYKALGIKRKNLDPKENRNSE